MQQTKAFSSLPLTTGAITEGFPVTPHSHSLSAFPLPNSLLCTYCCSQAPFAPRWLTEPCTPKSCSPKLPACLQPSDFTYHPLRFKSAGVSIASHCSSLQKRGNFTTSETAQAVPITASKLVEQLTLVYCFAKCLSHSHPLDFSYDRKYRAKQVVQCCKLNLSQ